MSRATRYDAMLRLTRGPQEQVLIESEAQERLGWNPHLFAFRKDFGAKACAGADGRANRGALTASQNGPDQCSYCRSPTNHDGGLLVRAHALPAVLHEVPGAHHVPGSRNGQGIYVKHQIGSCGNTAAVRAADHELGIGAPGNPDCTRVVENVAGDYCRKRLTIAR